MIFRIPEIHAYVNNHIHKTQPNYYEQYGIRKFGYWLQDVKKKPHQELHELMMSGMGKKLIKTFNKQSIPCALFVIFSTGGIDFVGGYAYYQFIKNNLLKTQQGVVDATAAKLGTLKLEQENGDQIH